MEAIEPIVSAILDDVVVREDGTQYIENYAGWVIQLREQPAGKDRVFVQLSVLANQFLEADCKAVAVSLAVLARMGLPHSKPQQAYASSPSAETP